MPTTKRFRVALSFPGEKRDYVSRVADALAEKLGRDAVFYDKWHEDDESYINFRVDLESNYHAQADLVVPFLCKDYAQKEWCGIEWRAILDLITRRPDIIMPLRFDMTKIVGLYETVDRHLDVSNLSSSEAAKKILARLSALDKQKSAQDEPILTESPEINQQQYQAFLLATRKQIEVAFTTPEKVATLLRQKFLAYQDWLPILDAHALSEKLTSAEYQGQLGSVFQAIREVVQVGLKQLVKASNYIEINELINNAEMILTSLLLFSAQKNVWLESANHQNSPHLTIRNQDLGCAELAAAARIQATPRYVYNPEEVEIQGKYAVSKFDLETGIGKGDFLVEEVSRKLWQKMFAKSSEDKCDLTKLRQHIKVALKPSKKIQDKKNCYLVINLKDKDAPIADEVFRRKLEAALPELPMIFLDETDESARYVLADEDLMIELYNFYEMIDNHAPQ